MLSYFGTLLLAGIALLLLSAIKILKEYERGVIFQLGRFYKVKGPGLIIVIPVIQQMVKTDLRVVVMDVPTQDVISKDNVSVKVNAVVYFRIVDPQRAIIQVENVYEATSQLAQTTLRSVLGQHDLDEMLSERDKLNKDIQNILDEHTDNWGIKVTNVEIKHVDLNESMIRAIAQQAEAERSRRAKVIHAEGELQASQRLLEAAQRLAEEPQAMQLRYLQTLSQVAGEKTNTIVFPLPLDLIAPLLERLPALAGRAVARLIDAVGLAFCAYLAWLGWRMTVFVAGTGQSSPTLGISMAWLYAVLPIGFGLLGLRYGLSLVGVLDRRRSVPAAGEPTP